MVGWISTGMLIEYGFYNKIVTNTYATHLLQANKKSIQQSAEIGIKVYTTAPAPAPAPATTTSVHLVEKLFSRSGSGLGLRIFLFSILCCLLLLHFFYISNCYFQLEHFASICSFLHTFSSCLFVRHRSHYFVECAVALE